MTRLHPNGGLDIDQARFRGSPVFDEAVFFHRPSRTAIFADLIQAFDDAFLKQNWSWWQRPLARLGGITASQTRRAARFAANLP